MTPLLLQDPKARDARPEACHPVLCHLFDRIGVALRGQGRLGLLSLTVLARKGAAPSECWQAYDAVVGEIGRFLQRYRDRRMRGDDTVLETGTSGNAFIVLLAPPRGGRPLDTADLDRARMRLKRGLKRDLGTLPREARERFGCYVGGALMRHDSDVALERIVYRALDEAFADALREREVEERRRAAHLSTLLDQGRIRTVYQPVVDLVECRVIGYEALTRVASFRFGSVELLFRAAHEHDAVWRLERLCRRKAIEGVPRVGAGELLFLNIEPQSVCDPELLDGTFPSLLERAGLGPEQVVLELTEHSEVRDFALFRKTLRRLRSLGFLLAMDDVGSGHAGLQSIAELAPDYIKMDIALVRHIHTNAIKRELIATIRRFADSMGIVLVAEGVECEEELESLMRIGVRRAQGYLFARPDSPPRVPDWSVLSGAPRRAGTFPNS